MRDNPQSIPEFDFSVSVEVCSLGSHSFEELAPLVDDFNDLWVDVSTQRFSHPPPMAGPQLALIDIAITAVFGVGIKAAWDLFFGKILDASAERIQGRLVDVIRSGSKRSSGARPPLSFTAGSVRFFIAEEITIQEFVQSLEDARHAGANLPESVFESEIPPGDGPHEWYWNPESGLWRYQGGPSAPIEATPRHLQTRWISNVPIDSQLETEVVSWHARLDREPFHNDFDDLLRRTFVTFEERIRNLAGLPAEKFGKDLVNAAFHLQTGVLQPISPSGAECAGLHHFMLGTILLFRNPVAHRSMSHSREAIWRILNHVNHAMVLAQEAANIVIDVSRYFSPHEGHIVRRRDFRLDVD